MKNQISTLVVFFLSLISFGQIGPNDDAVFLDSLDNLGTEANYKFIRIVKEYALEKDLYEVAFYGRSGKIVRRGTTSNKYLMAFEGPCMYYYENGNRKKMETYADKKIQGKQYEWYENGSMKLESEVVYDKKTNTSTTKIIHYWDPNNVHQVIDGEGEYEDTEIYTRALKKPYIVNSRGQIKNYLKEGTWTGNATQSKSNFTEKFTNGKLVSGILIDSLGIETKYTEIETKPKPQKGIEDFYQFIGKNYNTPQIMGLKGKIYVTFVVETDGTLQDIKVIKDIGYGTGAEAIRVVSKYEYWLPGKQRGIPVRVMYSLPITIQSKF